MEIIGYAQVARNKISGVKRGLSHKDSTQFLQTLNNNNKQKTKKKIKAGSNINPWSTLIKYQCSVIWEIDLFELLLRIKTSWKCNSLQAVDMTHY